MRLRLKKHPKQAQRHLKYRGQGAKIHPKTKDSGAMGALSCDFAWKNTQNKHKDTSNIEVKARKFTPKPRILVPWVLSVVTSLGKAPKTSTKTPQI